MPLADPASFRPDAVAPETTALNDYILATMAALPDVWAFPPHLIRQVRREGRGILPVPPASPRAEWIDIEGRHGTIRLRTIAPEQPKGVYLHLHGGGWTLGEADMQDDILERWVDSTGFAAISVGYRLAPEHPWPQGPDDCEDAALWLVEEGAKRFGTSHFVIGGESAGAHLSVVTLLRLRDRHGLLPFAGANLNAGCYDLGLTPSARLFGNERLILTTRDIRMFVKCLLRNGESIDDPDISPLYADPVGMPPALFSVGTRDALMDDSLFMAARWQAAGAQATLRLWPGGCHVFQLFDFPMAREAFEAEVAFVRGLAPLRSAA